MSGESGAAPINTSQDALGLGHKLARLAIKRILAPLIVAGHLGLDDAIDQIKLDVVAALADTGEANGFLAEHLSKSRSWFQDHLRRARQRERHRSLGIGSADTTVSADDGAAYSLVAKVAVALLAAYPETVSLRNLREQIGLLPWRMTDEELVRQVTFFSKLGVIRVVGYDTEGPLLQATEQFSVTGARSGQLERVEERLGWVIPLVTAYCQGVGDFGGFVGRLSPKALKRARCRLREAAADIFAEAIADTHRSDDPVESDVWVRVILAIGETGGFDGQ